MWQPWVNFFEWTTDLLTPAAWERPVGRCCWWYPRAIGSGWECNAPYLGWAWCTDALWSKTQLWWEDMWKNKLCITGNQGCWEFRKEIHYDLMAWLFFFCDKWNPHSPLSCLTLLVLLTFFASHSLFFFSAQSKQWLVVMMPDECDVIAWLSAKYITFD